MAPPSERPSDRLIRQHPGAPRWGPGREECLTEAEVVELLAGELVAQRLAVAQDHLDRCDRCRALLSAFVRDATAVSGTPPARLAALSGVRGSPAVLAPGSWIGNYRVDRPIGAGAMGVVYRGVDRSLERAVAIKLINRTVDGSDHARLERESRALARLSHRNVVTVYQIGEHEGRRYLVMEYIEGGTVREWLAMAPRSTREIVELFAQAGLGLAAVHDAGLVHRDIKPDNLLVGADRRVRVGDFGLVCTVAESQAAPARGIDLGGGQSARLTETGALMGTPRYMAPEVLRGEPADPRSDQWSFCASLWEALSGAPAFPGDLVTAFLRGAEPSPPSEPDGPGWIPRPLRRVLLRGLAHDPRERWPSMDALIAALDGRRRRLTRGVAAVLVAAVVGGVAVGVGLGRSSPPDPCATVGRELAATWSPARRDQLRRTLRSPPVAYPATVAASIDRELVRYSGAWLAARRSACRTARRDAAGERNTLAVSCLRDRRVGFAALLDELGRAPPRDPVVALEAAAGLAAVADCADDTSLANRQQPPAAQRARIAELRAGLEAARARLRLGGRDEAARAARTLLERARPLAFPPLTAESLRLAGISARAIGAPDARALLEEGLTSAEVAGDDVLAARLWTDLLDLARGSGEQQRRSREVARWLRHARAMATRLAQLEPRAHDQTLADLAAADGLLRRARGELAGAEASLREALMLESRSAGSDSPRVARAAARLAAVLSERGYREQADAERARAEKIARALIGAEGAGRLVSP